MRRHERWAARHGWLFALATVLLVACSPRQSGLDPPDGPGRGRPNIDQTADFAPRSITPAALREPPAGATFVFGDGVSEHIREEVRGAVGLAHDHFMRTGAGGVTELKVIAHNDVDLLIRDFRREVKIAPAEYGEPEFWRNHGGIAVGTTIFINLEDEYGEEDRQYRRWDIARIVGHEVAHAVHHKLAGIADPLSAVGKEPPPPWLTEGAAEVEAHTLLDAFGFTDYEDDRETYAGDAQSLVATLGDLEPGSPELYTLGFLGVDFLTQDGDLAPLRDFWTQLAAKDWRVAFEDAFGQTVDDFLAAFERHRQANFPRHRGELSGRVTNVEDLPGPASVWACGRGYGECYQAPIAASGEFALAVPDGRYTLEFGLDAAYGGERGFDTLYVVAPGADLSEDESEAGTFRVYGDKITGIDVSLPD